MSCGGSSLSAGVLQGIVKQDSVGLGSPPIDLSGAEVDHTPPVQLVDLVAGDHQTQSPIAPADDTALSIRTQIRGGDVEVVDTAVPIALSAVNTTKICNMILKNYL